MESDNMTTSGSKKWSHEENSILTMTKQDAKMLEIFVEHVRNKYTCYVN